MGLADLFAGSEPLRRLLERNPADARSAVRPPKTRAAYVLGLDLGQTHDYSALALDEISGDGEDRRHDIRHLRRWPLRTPYPHIVAEVAALSRRSPLTEEDTLVIDQTGVGRPVVDMFRAANPSVQLVPVTITAGSAATQEHGEWHVPKRDLIAAVTVALQSGRLRIAASLPDAATLREELATFQTKITLAANDVYGAWREGANDDTVLATALACWYGEHTGGGVGVWWA